MTVGDKWRDAMKRVELEDVGDAVGVSVRLPSLANVKVSNKGKHVVVTAYRAAGALRASNRATKEGGPKQITLKFEMVCSKTAEDVSYDYDCESGYLHLFLDGIKLAALSDQQRDDTMKSLRSRLAASAVAKAALAAATSGCAAAASRCAGVSRLTPPVGAPWPWPTVEAGDAPDSRPARSVAASSTARAAPASALAASTAAASSLVRVAVGPVTPASSYARRSTPVAASATASRGRAPR